MSDNTIGALTGSITPGLEQITAHQTQDTPKIQDLPATARQRLKPPPFPVDRFVDQNFEKTPRCLPFRVLAGLARPTPQQLLDSALILKGAAHRQAGRRCIESRDMQRSRLREQLASIKGATGERVRDAVERYQDLARDPARGCVPCDLSHREALAGLTAELTNVITGPIERDPSGHAEFIDGTRRTTWDVKSPLSPNQSQSFDFDAEHQLAVVATELFYEQDDGHGGSIPENVILDVTRMVPSDRHRVLELLRTDLSTWFEDDRAAQERIVVTYVPTDGKS